MRRPIDQLRTEREGRPASPTWSRRVMRGQCATAFLLIVFMAGVGRGADEPRLRNQAEQSLRKATTFFHSQVSTEGGYLWRYSEDLRRREGEGSTGDTTVWLERPGTPAVGTALLDAYHRTGQRYLLEMARDAGLCLVRGQLESGGWDNRIEFSPARRRLYAYRVGSNGSANTGKRRNTTTLDDDKTQSALRFLMRLDETLQLQDDRIHEAVEYGLGCLLNAQYPNGAWPQRYADFPEAADFPVKKASYPKSWSRAWPSRDYKNYYTFNDNAIADVIDIMFQAERTYHQPRYRAAAERAGGFILLAQMPQPQPAWAQQYDLDMHPAWARKFEPPSITGGESQGVMRTLLRLYRETGDRKYLQPIPRAMAYLRKSQLADGRLARFYELTTNRPLYFTLDYKLTYDDGDLPTHYGFKVGHKLDRITQEYQRLSKLSPSALAELNEPPSESKPRWSSALEKQTARTIALLDERGRWVEQGRLRYHGDDDPTRRIIQCQTFIANIGVLSRYLAATQSSSDRQ